jgi:hypothetical protein
VNQNSSDMYLSSIYSLLRTSCLGIVYFFSTLLIIIVIICARAHDEGYTITISNLFTYLLNVDLVLFFKKAGIFIFIPLVSVILVSEEKIAVPNTFPYSLAINALLGIAFFVGIVWLIGLFAAGIPQLHLFGR